MPTCKCGKTVDDMRGARGHIQFSAGEGHGEKGEVPSGWRDMFSEDDGDSQQDDDEPGATGDDPTNEPEQKPDTNESEPSERGSKLWRAVTEDVRALWGGDE
jgi:hypothetical protein